MLELTMEGKISHYPVNGAKDPVWKSKTQECTSVKMKDEGNGESKVLFKNKTVILMGKKNYKVVISSINYEVFGTKRFNANISKI